MRQRGGEKKNRFNAKDTKEGATVAKGLFIGAERQ